MALWLTASILPDTGPQDHSPGHCPTSPEWLVATLEGCDACGKDGRQTGPSGVASVAGHVSPHLQSGAPVSVHQLWMPCWGLAHVGRMAMKERRQQELGEATASVCFGRGWALGRAAGWMDGCVAGGRELPRGCLSRCVRLGGSRMSPHCCSLLPLESLASGMAAHPCSLGGWPTCREDTVQ